GARSFSIWNEAGELVYDSGSDLERITAERFPEHFNSDDENKFDSRSDDKGPEPEGVAIGTIDGNTYAFIGLERIGGVAVYDISTPTAPEFVNYATSRNFAAGGSDAVELAPEGITFIAAADSPSGDNLLVMSNEVSGSTTIYRIQAR
ncbi:MAG: hypothetical protein OXC81_06770, partial [Betaproteobacteria bacterium]|nr:hypothetical protein [Betaproteobacteria bacterium]